MFNNGNNNFQGQFGGTPYYGNGGFAPVQGLNGYGYQPPQQQPPMIQLCTSDELKKMRENPELFTLNLSDIGYCKSICTHKDPNGTKITLELQSNGKVRCPQCGVEFYLLDPDTPLDQIKAKVYEFKDIFETIKTYYGNAPVAMRDYYVISGLIEKIPQLWEIATKYFKKATQNSNNMMPNDYTNNFNILGQLMGPSLGIPNNNYYGYGPQPGYYNGYPNQQPQQNMYSAPQQQMNYGPQNVQQPNQQYQQNPNQFGAYGNNAAQNSINNPMNQPMQNGLQNNPIGYPEPSQNDFNTNPQNMNTVNASVQMPGVQQPMMGQSNNGISGGTQIPIETPANPNTKGSVTKKFQ